IAGPVNKTGAISPEVKFEPLPPLPPKERKSVWVAFLWSCLPTGGMYYVGKWGWGIGYGVLMVGGMVTGTVLSSRDDMWTGFGITVGSMMVGYFGSMIHAVVAAAYWEPEDEQADLLRDFSTVQAIGPGSDPFPAVTIPIFWGNF
ncbi:MAG: hypothetical protein JRJ87_06770, partial [Deltaproteobacteria bacterium]|nr:hypothetical protein [Deltaproteobacteria bacterium]